MHDDSIFYELDKDRHNNSSITTQPKFVIYSCKPCESIFQIKNIIPHILCLPVSHIQYQTTITLHCHNLFYKSINQPQENQNNSHHLKFSNVRSIVNSLKIPSLCLENPFRCFWRISTALAWSCLHTRKSYYEDTLIHTSIPPSQSNTLPVKSLKVSLFSNLKENLHGVSIFIKLRKPGQITLHLIPVAIGYTFLKILHVEEKPWLSLQPTFTRTLTQSVKRVDTK